MKNTILTLATVGMAFWGLTLLRADPPAKLVETMNTPDSNTTNKTEVADLGGGCFWCMEAVFERLPGVISVTSGFAGGTTENPTYQDVCTETTDHAEVTEIEFDPAKISYAKLLEVFWQAHDPTTLNRQGPDVGAQYRSAIFFHTPEQQAAAQASKEKMQAGYKNRIVTEITPTSEFYRAEDYHQQYLEKRGLAHCSIR